MAGFGTKKEGSDIEQQLTFPTVFADAYAKAGLPTKYFGSIAPERLDEVSGDDMMANIHRLRREEAYKRVMNGVSATKNAINRYLVSYNGYYNLPKPVLSQRIYANPSNGSGGLGGDLYSARRTAPDIDAPFRCTANGVQGGVLRTMEGQKYGQMLLQKRIDQLNKIDELKDSGLAISALPAESGISVDREVGPADLVKLSALLSQLVDGLAAGNIREINRFALTDLSDMTTLIFHLMPRLSREQIENVIEALDDAEELSRAIEDELVDLELRNEEEIEIELPKFGEAIAIKDLKEYEKLLELRGYAKSTISQYLTAQRKENEAAEKYNKLLTSAVATSQAEMEKAYQRIQELQKEKELSPIKQNVSYVSTLITLIPKLRSYVEDMYDVVDTKTEKEKKIISKSLVKKYGLDKYYSLGATKAKLYMPTEKFTTRPEKRESSEKSDRPVLLMRSNRKLADKAIELAQKAELQAEREARKPQKAEPAGANRGAVEVGAAANIRARGKAVKLSAQFDLEPRNVFAERSGSYYGEQKPLDYIAHVNPMRTQTDDRTKQNAEYEMAKAREAMAPKEVSASGKKPKKWIQEAVIKMKKGAFTKQAKRAHESPLEFAKTVLAKPEKFAKKTEKRAQFLQNIAPKNEKLINGSGKAHRGAYHQMEDGSFWSGAKHTKRSKLLSKA